MGMRSTILAIGLLAGAQGALGATFSGYDFTLNGAASILSGGDLQLTSPSGNQSAGAWFTSPWSTTDSFSVSFSFSLTSAGFDPMADGISFTLHGQGANALGGGGGDIGVDGLNGVSAVVQTWDNNRTGLTTTGSAFDAPTAPANLGNAALVTGLYTLNYDAGTQLLSLTGNLVVDGNSHVINDSTTIDLQARFGATMTAGFTGGTGLSWADQRILAVTLSPVPEPEIHALMLAGLALVAGVARARRSRH